jgi:hypothetical protein
VAKLEQSILSAVMEWLRAGRSLSPEITHILHLKSRQTLGALIRTRREAKPGTCTIETRHNDKKDTTTNTAFFHQINVLLQVLTDLDDVVHTAGLGSRALLLGTAAA